METGDYQRADSDLGKAIDLDPGYYWHYIDRGRVRLLGLRDPEAAMEDFSKAVQIDPEYFYAYVYRGGIYDQADERTEAIADYLKVLDAKPDYFYIYAPLGVLFYMEARWDDAERYLRKAYEYDEQEHFYAYLIALAMLRDGDEAGARRYVERAAFPRESLYYRLARLFLDPGSEGFVTGEVSREETVDLKMKALYVLAVYYQHTGRAVIAQRYFLEVEEKAFSGGFEQRLSTWELGRYREEGSE
jgi:tetratricopeptide (TPR) repeat protein